MSMLIVILYASLLISFYILQHRFLEFGIADAPIRIGNINSIFKRPGFFKVRHSFLYGFRLFADAFLFQQRRTEFGGLGDFAHAIALFRHLALLFVKPERIQLRQKKNGNGKKAAAGAAAAGAGAIAANGGPNEEADEPNIADHAVTEYACELGNKITIYKNANDIDHIALRWKQRLHRLTRVATTTGAERYENKLYGLIWIGIPAKGMLLDSKANRQLANECKTAEQKNGL